MGKVREVFGCHPHVDVQDVFFSEVFLCDGSCFFDEFGIVIYVGVAVIDEDVGCRSVGFCRVFGYAVYEFVCLFTPVLVEGADYAFQIDFRGYDIGSSFGYESSDGKGCRHCGIGVATDKGLECNDNM